MEGCGYYRHKTRGDAELALATIMRQQNSRKHRRQPKKFYSVSYCIECQAFHVREQQ